MAVRTHLSARLMAGASLTLIAALAAGSALAATAAPLTGTGAEGTEVSDVIVTAERNQAAATAPAKASLEQTQPEAIISRSYIEQVTPEVGGWTTVVTIAPSMSGITSNGGGVGEYNKVTMRGFQDGQFNITYDGISFGDTNDPTHHAASYWPSSTIGAAVVDRGPGAAGDMGQANFGGAIHYFSQEPTERFGVVQKVTYGSYDTEAAVTTINSGAISQLGGGKLLLNFDERWSAGELSHSGGNAFNQLIKYVQPIGEKATLTFFAAHEWTKFYLADAGPGETADQVKAYGKDFALTNIPTDEHYYKFNYQKKQTDFEYIDLKYQITPSIALEEQPYTYFYSNKTIAANDITGLVGGTNTSPPNNSKLPSTDIGGYDKLNEYRVYGDITRINKEWSFGTLKIGGLVESSKTDRHNFYIDLTQGGIADNAYKTAPLNAKLLESSNWNQWQVFADFDWHVTDALRISPGFKYVDFTRSVAALAEKVAGGTKHQSLYATNTYTSPLYFLTVNYKIRSDWSVYGQFATSFLIPSLSALYTAGANTQDLKPETTTTYQAGTVFTHGNVTADADVYRIDASNLYLACGSGANASYCNLGKAEYRGVEGEVAYAFGFGLTLFANGSLNSAEQIATAAGSKPTKGGELANAPKWTDASGVIYHHGPWQGSVTYKQSGAYISDDARHMSGYDSVDASAAYDFGHFKVKLQGFNLFDKRSVTSLNGGLYTFQAGRELQLTLIAKY
ncbi:MAG: TonB-dependent receptor [Caulobacteraceae bacterium]|nr:TonB-dependent receptor [Caulobacteraceae bacterium]